MLQPSCNRRRHEKNLLSKHENVLITSSRNLSSGNSRYRCRSNRRFEGGAEAGRKTTHAGPRSANASGRAGPSGDGGFALAVVQRGPADRYGSREGRLWVFFELMAVIRAKLGMLNEEGEDALTKPTWSWSEIVRRQDEEGRRASILLHRGCETRSQPGAETTTQAQARQARALSAARRAGALSVSSPRFVRLFRRERFQANPAVPPSYGFRVGFQDRGWWFEGRGLWDGAPWCEAVRSGRRRRAGGAVCGVGARRGWNQAGHRGAWDAGGEEGPRNRSAVREAHT
ncbi:unnamed protein product [Ascophyllum nodosum]